MKTKLCKHWFAFILLAATLVACSESQVTATSTTAHTTIAPTITPPPPTATVAPTATAIPLVWRQIYDGQGFARDLIEKVFVDPADQNILYVSTKHSGIYKTMDGGNSWLSISKASMPNDVLVELMRPVNQDEYFNIGQDGIRRLYKFEGQWFISEDNRMTWRRFSEGGTYNSHTIAFDPSGSFYIFCGDNICRFSPDGTDLNILGNPEVGIDSLVAISPLDPNTIYAAGEGLSVSSDGGHSWKQINNGLGNTILQLDENPAVLYLLTGECNRYRGRSTIEQPMYRSMDGGLTWEYLGNKGCFLIKDADLKSVYRLATDSDDFDPWIWQITGDGRYWNKILIPSAITTLVAHPTIPGMMFAFDNMGTSKQYYLRRNAGSMWELSESREVSPCYGETSHFLDRYKPMAIDTLNSNHVLYVENNHVLESHDGCSGSGVSIIGTGNVGKINSVEMYPNDSSTIYLGTDNGAYVSFDGGKTWGQVNDGLTIPTVVYSIAVDKDGNVYASTPYGIYQLASK